MSSKFLFHVSSESSVLWFQSKNWAHIAPPIVTSGESAVVWWMVIVVGGDGMVQDRWTVILVSVTRHSSWFLDSAWSAPGFIPWRECGSSSSFFYPLFFSLSSFFLSHSSRSEQSPKSSSKVFFNDLGTTRWWECPAIFWRGRDMKDREKSSRVEDLCKSSGEGKRWNAAKDLPG